MISFYNFVDLLTTKLLTIQQLFVSGSFQWFSYAVLSNVLLLLILDPSTRKSISSSFSILFRDLKFNNSIIGTIAYSAKTLRYRISSKPLPFMTFQMVFKAKSSVQDLSFAPHPLQLVFIFFLANTVLCLEEIVYVKRCYVLECY